MMPYNIIQRNNIQYFITQLLPFSIMALNTEWILSQTWMAINGPQTSCKLIHPNTICPVQILIKCATVVKRSSKMYLTLYTAVVLLQMNRIIRQKKYKKSSIKLVKDFVGSLAFMSWLVGGMKTGLCILNSMNSPLNIYATNFLSLVGSTSIFFNQQSKQAQIAYFVIVRAIRSSYIFIKKRWKFPLQRQREFSFIFIFVLLSYLYFEGHSNLKYRNLLQNLWGQF